MGSSNNLCKNNGNEAIAPTSSIAMSITKTSKNHIEDPSKLHTWNEQITPQDATLWGGGLLTTDDIKIAFKYIDEGKHPNGKSPHIKAWPGAKTWLFLLHKNFRHPTRHKLASRGKT